MMSLAETQQASRDGPEPGLSRPDGTPIRVLVVDDEPSLAELLASVLRYEGFQAVTAADGGSAVRAARGRRSPWRWRPRPAAPN
jgi:two-component system OmpR family response regulator